jgi:membrane associated rhomboid family serine protease
MSETPVTYIIIAVTVILSYLSFNNESLLQKLIFHPESVKDRKQYYRFITHGFIHADFQHLIFNMISLYFFRYLEIFFTHHIGSFGFLMIYLGAIVASEIPSYLKHINNAYYSSLGASGAVSAMIFGFIIFDPWMRFQFPPVPAIVYAILYLGYSFYMDRQGGDNINHSAHIFGALFGIGAVILVDPEMIQHFIRQLQNPRLP